MKRGHQIARRRLRSRAVLRFGAAAPATTVAALTSAEAAPFSLRDVSSRVGMLSLIENRAVLPCALPVALRRADLPSQSRPSQNRGPFPWLPAKGATSEARSAFHRQILFADPCWR